MDSKTLGQTLKKIRESKGMTQNKVALKLGWAQNRIHESEKGERHITVDSLVKIGSVLGFEITLTEKK